MKIDVALGKTNTPVGIEVIWLLDKLIVTEVELEKLNVPEGITVMLLECKSISIEADREDLNAFVGMNVIWLEYKIKLASEVNIDIWSGICVSWLQHASISTNGAISDVGTRKAVRMLLNCISFKLWLLQLRRDVLYDVMVQVQGEMDEDEGQLEATGRTVDDVVDGRLVVVVETQLEKPNELRMATAVPLEHLPPMT